MLYAWLHSNTWKIFLEVESILIHQCIAIKIKCMFHSYRQWNCLHKLNEISLIAKLVLPNFHHFTEYQLLEILLKIILINCRLHKTKITDKIWVHMIWIVHLVVDSHFWDTYYTRLHVKWQNFRFIMIWKLSFLAKNMGFAIFYFLFPRPRFLKYDW